VVYEDVVELSPEGLQELDDVLVPSRRAQGGASLAEHGRHQARHALSELR